MDREVSSVVSISVTMIALALLITTVLGTISIGNVAKQYVVSRSMEIAADTSTGELDSIAGGDSQIMPKASIYYIIAKEHSGVTEVDYTTAYIDTNGNSGVINNVLSGNYTMNKKGQWVNTNTAIHGNNYSFYYPSDALDANGLSGKASVQVYKENGGMYKISVTDVLYN